MCGISGFVDFKKESCEESLVELTDSIKHRGTDSSGYYFEQLDNAQIGLGHRRLSIIDLSNQALQPMGYQNLKIL